MSDSVSVLLAAGIIIPIVFLLIYAAFRNFFNSARSLKEALRQTDVPREAADSQPDDLKKRQAAAVSALMTEFQAQSKRSDDAHKARIRAHVERKIPPISNDGRQI